MLDTSDLETRGWLDPEDRIKQDMDRCRQALSAHYCANDVERWLNTPHGSLCGYSAANRIRAGETARVLDVIRQLDGMIAT